MRLVCPNCEAQYEVDDAAIPPAGRDVQCSACGHGWFHRPPTAAAPVTPAAPPSAGARLAAPPQVDPAKPAMPPRRPLDENVMAVLREEALREAAARRAESARAFEPRPDPALAATATTGRMPSPSDPPAPPAAPPAVAEAAAPAPAAGGEDAMAGGRAAGPRRELLPDIEEINSTLSGASGRRDAGRGGARASADRGGGGFRTGFLAMLIACALLALAYGLAPRLAEQMPGLAPTLDSYVAAVDGLRLAVSGLVRRAGSMLDGSS